MKRNTRERRIPPHSHLGLTGGTLYNDPTGAHCTMTQRSLWAEGWLQFRNFVF